MAISGNDTCLPDPHGWESYFYFFIHCNLSSDLYVLHPNSPSSPPFSPPIITTTPSLSLRGGLPRPNISQLQLQQSGTRLRMAAGRGGGSLGVVKERQTYVRILDLGGSGLSPGSGGLGERRTRKKEAILG